MGGEAGEVVDFFVVLGFDAEGEVVGGGADSFVGDLFGRGLDGTKRGKEEGG